MANFFRKAFAPLSAELSRRALMWKYNHALICAEHERKSVLQAQANEHYFRMTASILKMKLEDMK